MQKTHTHTYRLKQSAHLFQIFTNDRGRSVCWCVSVCRCTRSLSKTVTITGWRSPSYLQRNWERCCWMQRFYIKPAAKYAYVYVCAPRHTRIRRHSAIVHITQYPSTTCSRVLGFFLCVCVCCLLAFLVQPMWVSLFLKRVCNGLCWAQTHLTDSRLCAHRHRDIQHTHGHGHYAGSGGEVFGVVCDVFRLPACHFWFCAAFSGYACVFVYMAVSEW